MLVLLVMNSAYFSDHLYMNFGPLNNTLKFSDLEGYKVHAWSHRIALNQQKCSKFNKI
jgi:hypothetical protein